jgi:hypothetical protein
MFNKLYVFVPSALFNEPQPEESGPLYPVSERERLVHQAQKLGITEKQDEIDDLEPEFCL